MESRTPINQFRIGQLAGRHFYGYGLAFSPDGKYVVSGSRDTTARIWIWQPNDLTYSACASLPRNLTRAEWNQYIGDALPYQAVCPNLPIEAEITPTPGMGK
jgi:WD40 repeat protein